MENFCRILYTSIILTIFVVSCSVSPEDTYYMFYPRVTQSVMGDSASWTLDGDTFRIETNLVMRLPNDVVIPGAFVPYSGATGNININPYCLLAYMVTADSIDAGKLYLSSGKIYDGSGDSVIIREGLSGTMAYLSDVPNTDDFVQASDTVGFALRSWVQSFYQPILTNPVTGTGVANKVAVWNSTSTITNTDIKTVGGETLLGAGNIDFPSVAYDTTEITTTIDFSTSRIFYRSISGTTTFTATNLAPNKDVVLKLTVTGSPTINFSGLIGETPFLQDVTAYIGLKAVNTTQYILTFINEVY